MGSKCKTKNDLILEFEAKICRMEGFKAADYESFFGRVTHLEEIPVKARSSFLPKTSSARVTISGFFSASIFAGS